MDVTQKYVFFAYFHYQKSCHAHDLDAEAEYLVTRLLKSEVNERDQFCRSKLPNHDHHYSHQRHFGSPVHGDEPAPEFFFDGFW